MPHVTYPQPSSVSTTAMMDTPLTAQTCIHQTATHPKPLSIFLLSLTMAQAQPRNARILLLPHPTPHQAALSRRWGRPPGGILIESLLPYSSLPHPASASNFEHPE